MHALSCKIAFMNSTYELYFIVNPELSSEQTNTLLANVQELLSSVVKAENVDVEQEGLKNLAYPIQKHWSGYYVNIRYEVSDANKPAIKDLEARLNLLEPIIRYLNLNISEYLIAKSKEVLNETEITTHRELNKGRASKICLSKYLGLKAIDYKDVDYLNQFTSPYAKIFDRSKTGTSAKFQRKITKAIKQARHMGLMPFTTKHYR